MPRYNPNTVRSCRVTHEGRSFASKGERDCYEYLKILERAGEIEAIEFQVPVELVKGYKHKIDFKCFDIKRGEPLWVEYKGFVDAKWLMTKRLWRTFGPGRLKVYNGYGIRMKLIDDIIPEEKEK